MGLGGGDSDALTVSSYLGATFVDSEVLIIADDLNGQGTWQTAVMLGPIDEVRVTSSLGSDFAIDNVVYVPEPGAAISLLFGAGMLARLARRRER